MLSEQTKAILTRAGWFPGRRIDVGPIESALTIRGNPPGKRALAFLQEFGDLHLKVPNPRVRRKKEDIDFDAVEAARRYSMGWIDRFEVVLGVKLTVVGGYGDGYMTFLLSEDGALYSAVNDFLLWHGVTEDDSLNALCEGILETEVAYENPEDK